LEYREKLEFPHFPVLSVLSIFVFMLEPGPEQHQTL
jgi:hypothetical protein